MFNIYETILIFFIYAFVGWLWEVILSFFQYRKFINRGFLIGPYLPIYGFGGLIATVFFTKFDIGDGILNILIIFICTTIICSILEYFTSWLMEKLFNNRWWDYSEVKFNINGRICLLCSLGFGAGCTIALKLTNPVIRNVIDMLSIPTNIIRGLDLLFILIILIDSMVSFKIIKNFKDISNTVVEDSTEKITSLVKKTILKNYNVLYRRLVESFPTMQINNRLSLIRERILDEQKKIEKATYKLNLRKNKVRELEKEINMSKAKKLKNTILNIFKRK